MAKILKHIEIKVNKKRVFVRPTDDILHMVKWITEHCREFESDSQVWRVGVVKLYYEKRKEWEQRGF